MIFFYEDKKIRFIYKELDSKAVTIADDLRYNRDISSISINVFKENFYLLIREEGK